MRQSLAHEDSLFESLSDMAMAALGIFIIFFVINLLYLNNDFIQESIRETKLKSVLSDVKADLDNFVSAERQRIEAYKKSSEKELAVVDDKIIKIQEELDDYEKYITTAQNKVKQVMNVDKVISIEEIRKLLQQVKLKRKRIDKKLKKIRLKTNHVRQEFNKYKEVENSHPYIEIGVNGKWITLNNVDISIDNFRAIIQEINAGSGFRFRMKKEWTSNGYKNQVTPDWINHLLISEGWMPIIDIQ